MRIAVIKDNNIAVQNNYSQQCLDDLFTANETLNRMMNWKCLFQLFEKSYSYFKEYFSTLNKSHETIDIFLITTKINEYLSSGYKYLETVKKYFLNQFPENGQKKYDEFTHEIYDKNFSYRLVCNIRNCFQHVGEGGVYIETDVDHITVILKKSEYINFHDGIQHSFKKELEAMTEDIFNLLDNFDKFFSNINDLNISMSNFIFDTNAFEFFDASMNILITLNDLDNESHYVFYESSKAESDIGINLKPINIEFAKDVIDLYCRYFILSGCVIPVPVTNHRFPSYMNENGQKPTISIGDRLVKENEFIWEKYFEQISLDLTHYIGIYVPTFFDQVKKAKICEIAKKHLLGNN